MQPTEPYPVPYGKTVRGQIRVPSSKSVTHRYFNLALLSRAPVIVDRPLLAEDTELFLSALERCGFGVSRGSDTVHLTPPSSPPPATAAILCGNAGTMYRFLVATLTTQPGAWLVDGTPRLRERPVGPLLDALRSLGAKIDCLQREGYAPLRITGASLQGGRVTLDASQSSQYLSAILMAACRARGEVLVDVEGLISTPYVEITLEALSSFGARVERTAGGSYRVEPAVLAADRLEVEGDYSAAAYPAAAAALTGGAVRIEGLRPDAKQGDRRFLTVLRQMGALVHWQGDRVEVMGTGVLDGLDADFSDLPDQVPTLAALAPFCRGTTRVSNVAHLRIKESDRLRAMATQLTRLGAEAKEEPDGLVIQGGWSGGDVPRAEVAVEVYDDHRIAMSLAVVGLRRPGVVINDPGVVAKSYPGFWRDLEALLHD